MNNEQFLKEFESRLPEECPVGVVVDEEQGRLPVGGSRALAEFTGTFLATKMSVNGQAYYMFLMLAKTKREQAVVVDRLRAIVTEKYNLNPKFC